MSGSRAVNDNHVIIAALFVLLDLAKHDDIVDSRRRSTDHVDDTGFVQSLGDSLKTMVPEVLVECISGRYLNDFKSAARRVITGAAKKIVEGRLAVKFDHEYTSSVTTSRASDDSRYCCLSDTPLARHNDNIRGGQRLQRTLMFRRHLCAD